MSGPDPGPLRYQVLGPAGAPAILLSAGLGGLGAYWRPQLETLLTSFRVILYDQRGTGQNAGPLPADTTIGAMAEDAAAILAACGAGPCHVMGHALGGLIGLELALRHPGAVRSLVVVNGWARLDSHTARCFSVRRQLLAAGGAAAYAQAQPIFLYPAAWLSAHAEQVAAEEAHGVQAFQGEATLLARIGALSRFDVTGRLGGLTVPTLVVAARDDVLVPFTCGEALARAIPGASLAVLPEGGHACNITEPAAFAAAVLPWLQASAGPQPDNPG